MTRSARRDVRFRGADDRVVDRSRRRLERHDRAEADPRPGHRRLDDDRRPKARLDRLDPALQERLLLARGVVVGVLLEVAELLRRPDPRDDLGPPDPGRARRARPGGAPRRRRSAPRRPRAARVRSPRPRRGRRARLPRGRRPSAFGARAARRRRRRRRRRAAGRPASAAAAPRPARAGASRSARSPCARRSAGAGWRTAGSTSGRGAPPARPRGTPSANAVNRASSYSSIAVVAAHQTRDARRRAQGVEPVPARGRPPVAELASRSIAATSPATDVSDDPMKRTVCEGSQKRPRRAARALEVGPCAVQAERLDPLDPLADAGQLDRRRGQRSGDLDDEHPGPGRWDRPSPDDGPVGQEADGAKQSGRGSIGVHRPMVPATRPRYRAARHGAPSIRLGRIERPVTPSQPAARRRSARRLAASSSSARRCRCSWPSSGPVPAGVGHRSRPISSAGPVGRRAPAAVPGWSCATRSSAGSTASRGARDGIPGVSAAILVRRRLDLARNERPGRHQTGEAVEPDTAFAVASVSKTFTAALILRLARGRPARPRRTRPPSTCRSSASTDAITVRQLLDHTSGLRDFFFHPRIDKALLADRGRTWDAARSLTYVGKPYFKPGKGWHYSNTNYLLLGLVAERSAGGRSPSSWRRASSPRSTSTTPSSSRRIAGRPGRAGYRFDRRQHQAAGRSTCPTGRRSRRSPRSSPPPGRPVRSPRRRTTSSAGRARSTAASVLDPTSRRRDGRRRRADRRAGPGDPVRARRPGGDDRRPPDARPLGPVPRLPGGRPLAADERIAIAVLTNQSRTDPSLVARSCSGSRSPPSMGGCVECREPL